MKENKKAYILVEYSNDEDLPLYLNTFASYKDIQLYLKSKFNIDVTKNNINKAITRNQLINNIISIVRDY